jgi:EAL domain-containing protein (putative c-di-GMP-specific phosphodiesterase class I)
LKRLDESFEIEGHQIFVAASAGVANAPRDGINPEDLLANANLGLHDAKAAGGRAIRLYSPSLRAQAQERRQLGNELRRAWANREFVLHFQPQLRLQDEKIVGAEALLRWRHPQRGLLAPGAFIGPLADSPIALEVGRWILIKACQTAAEWRTNGGLPIRVGVNLFPAQFRQGTLLDDVRAALAESALPPDALELEITENIALAQDEKLLDVLNELRSKGVGLAFDDFGTGFASLSYLARFPFTRIKIDRSFVQNISNESGAGDTAIVRSIIVMAHNLGMEVTAEGVETPAQTAFLRAKRCDEMQGFLYSKPLPAAAFEEFVEAARRNSRARQEIAG